MFSLFRTNRFLDRLRAPVDPGEAQQVNRVLAVARTMLAFCSLVAIRVDPTEPSRYDAMVLASLLAYIAFSLCVLFVWTVRKRAGPAFPWSAHAVDIVWAAFVTLFTGGPNSPFFLFFLFVLLAAAYRWGLRETMMTSGIVIVLLFIQALVLVSSHGPVLLEGEFELNRFIMRTTYLLILGFFFGYLAEEEKQLKAQSSAIVRVIAKARVEAGMSRSLRSIFEEVLRLFASNHLLLATQEASSGRAYFWEVRRMGATEETQVQLSELEPARRHLYLFDSPAHGWYARRRRGRAVSTIALDGEGRRLRNCSFSFLDGLGSAQRFDSALAAAVVVGEEWSGRLFVFDPAASDSPVAELRFLQSLLRQLSPAIYNNYLVRRLRSRAGAIERARVARELHDGSIQSLTAMEMEIDVLRRQMEGAPPRVTQALGRIQQLLRQEVLNLRELMEQLKPIELNSKQLVKFLADCVAKFRRETGISADFAAQIEHLNLAPRCCNEIARIVQEALVNVRKHSSARTVLVRLTSNNGICQLVIDDDGAGFSFSGRLSQAELDAAHKGPAVIKERVRALGGELAIESAPGCGARLEITIPSKAYGKEQAG